MLPAYLDSAKLYLTFKRGANREAQSTATGNKRVAQNFQGETFQLESREKSEVPMRNSPFYAGARLYFFFNWSRDLMYGEGGQMCQNQARKQNGCF